MLFVADYAANITLLEKAFFYAILNTIQDTIQAFFLAVLFSIFRLQK